MNNSLNIQQLIAVAEKLKDIKNKVVFVGGSTTALLVDSAAANSARQTKDVDFIIEIAAQADLYKFEQKMRNLGFTNDLSKGAPICRWLMDFYSGQLKVDAMPTTKEIMGFTNQWYSDAIKTPWTATLKNDLEVQVIDPAYFLGTKFEAYKGRGGGQIFSHDIEDIIYVLEHRSTIESEVVGAPNKLRAYLAKKFSTLIKHPDLENTLPGILDDTNAANMVIGKMERIASSK